MYNDLINYLNDNELTNLVDDIRNDTNVTYILTFINDHFNDEVVLKDLDTKVIKDMYLYVINHKIAE